MLTLGSEAVEESAPCPSHSPFFEQPMPSWGTAAPKNAGSPRGNSSSIVWNSIATTWCVHCGNTARTTRRTAQNENSRRRSTRTSTKGFWTSSAPTPICSTSSPATCPFWSVYVDRKALPPRPCLVDVEVRVAVREVVGEQVCDGTVITELALPHAG